MDVDTNTAEPQAATDNFAQLWFVLGHGPCGVAPSIPPEHNLGLHFFQSLTAIFGHAAPGNGGTLSHFEI
jgi:hypothetical protein